MVDGLRGGLDYLAFCSGMALWVSAVPALRAMRRGPSPELVWRGYFAFALLSGLADWVTMARLDLAESAWLRAGEWLLLAAAYLALFSLAQRERLAHGLRRLPSALPVACCLVGVVGGCAGQPDLALGLGLALPIALATAHALFRSAPMPGLVAWATRVGSLAIVVRAVGLTCPARGLVCTALLAATSLTLLVSISLLLAGRRSADGADGRVDLAVSLAVAVAAAMGWYGAVAYTHRVASDLHGRLTRQAVYLARTVNPASARQLSFSRADYELAADRELRSQMRQYNRAFGLWNTYSFARRGDHLVFGPESLEPGDPMASPPGTIYEHPAPQFWRVLETREATAFGPYTDEYGTFHSAVAPVLDPRTGETLMAVGVDMQATEWVAQVRRGRLVALGGAALVTALLTLIWLLSDQLGGLLGRRLTLSPDAVAAALAGLVLTSAAVWSTSRDEDSRRRATFLGLAEAQAQVVTQMLRQIDDTLVDTARLTADGETPTGGWATRQMAAMVGRGGLRELWWVHGTDDGRHWTVTQQVSPPGATDVVGSDLAGRPALAGSIVQALLLGASAATMPADGDLSVGREHTLLVLRPAGTGSGEAANRRGLVVGVLDPQQLLHHGLAMTSYDSSQVLVGLAQLEAQAPRLLAWHPSESLATRALLTEVLASGTPDRTAVFPIFLFGRALVLAVSPSAAFDERNPQRAGWLAAFVGLVVTALLALLLNGYSARREELAALVAARTQSLRDSEERFRRIVQAIPDAIFIADAQGRFVLVNDSACQQLGYTEQELLDMSAMDIVHPDYAERAAARLRSMQGDRHMLDSAHVRSDGRLVPVEVAVTPMTMDGEPHLLAIAHDVTERRAAEQALRDSEAYRQCIFETSLVPIVVLDPETMAFVDGNPAAAAAYGYERREQLLGRTPLDLSPEYQRDGTSSAEMAQRVVSQALNEGDAHFPWKHLRPSGEVWDADVRLMPFETAGRRLLQVSLRDITDQLVAEETARREQQLTEALVTSLPGIFYLFDDQNRMVRWNRTLQRYTGRDSADMVGAPALRAVDPADHDAVREAMERIWRDGHGTVEATIVSLSGQRAPFLLSGERVDLPDGRYLVGVGLDISTLRQAEVEREALITRLEQSNAELERFTYTVSHDLKSPLITIKGFLSWLRADLAQGRTDRLDRSMDRIANAAEHMGRLLDELLELSRIGRLTNATQRIDMAELASGAAELVNARLEQAGMRVVIAPDLPAVLGDRPRLLEVLQNLIENAAKFVGDQSEPQVAIGCDGTDEQLGWPLFYVRDNGQGFDPAYGERIFGLFDQLDAQQEGTGIGLAMVKRIVEFHGGRVWAESAGPGQGACLWFTLPPADEA